MSTRSEYIRQTVAEALDPVESTDLREVIRSELVDLWTDLNEAQQSANDRVWSMRCNGLVYRIVRLSRLVGACPYGEVPVTTVVNGVYEEVHRQAGIPYEPIDWPAMRELDDQIRGA